ADTASAAASGGYYSALSFSGGSWRPLTSWVLLAADLSIYRGCSFLPLLRFQNVPAMENLQFRLSLSVGGVTLYRAPASFYPAGQGYLALVPLRLPPGDLPGRNSAAAQTLTLEVLSPLSGSYALDLDYLFLMPQNSFAHYQPIATLGQNSKLLDDTFTNQSWSLISDQELPTHQRLGNSPFLSLVSANYFYIFQTNGANLAPIDQTISVKAWYRKRTQVI
ncbi:MAG: hypothetical protein WA110_08235, partial [Anaerolineaceae bacterium]